MLYYLFECGMNLSQGLLKYLFEKELFKPIVDNCV